MFILGQPRFEGDAGTGGSASGSAEGTAAAASSAAQPPAAAPAPTVTDSFTGIPEKYRNDPDYQNFQSLDDIFSEHKQFKTRVSDFEKHGFVELVGEGSAPEQVDAFYKKLGKPGSPVEYEFARPEDLPQGIDYSDETAAKFAEFAHSQHFTKAQAQAAHSFYHDMVKEAHSSYEAMETQAIEANFQELESKWGAQDSETFQVHHKNAMRAFNHVADPDLAAKFKENPSLASNPLVLDVLARLGSKMSQDIAPSITGTLPTGQFNSSSLQSIDKAISTFQADGRFKKMMESNEPNEVKQLKSEWQALWNQRNEAAQK